MSTFVIHTDQQQEKIVRAFLEALDISFERQPDMTSQQLPEHVIKGIAEGQADFEAGRTISMEEFKKKLLMFK